MADVQIITTIMGPYQLVHDEILLFP